MPLRYARAATNPRAPPAREPLRRLVDRRGRRRAKTGAARPGVGAGPPGRGSTRPFCCDRLRRPRASSSGRIRPQRPHEAASGRIRPASSPATCSLDLATNGLVSPLLSPVLRGRRDFHQGPDRAN